MIAGVAGVAGTVGFVATWVFFLALSGVLEPFGFGLISFRFEGIFAGGALFWWRQLMIFEVDWIFIF